MGNSVTVVAYRRGPHGHVVGVYLYVYTVCVSVQRVPDKFGNGLDRLGARQLTWVTAFDLNLIVPDRHLNPYKQFLSVTKVAGSNIGANERLLFFPDRASGLVQ